MKNKKIIIIAIVVVLLFAGVALFCGYQFGKKDNNNNNTTIEEPKKEEKPVEEEPVEEPTEEPKEEPPKEPEYKSLNVDEVIKKYKLDSIKKSINKDQEFFKEYAYTIINNKNIDYPKQVLLMYKVVMANDKNLDKEYLIQSLKDLKVIRTTEEIFAATYNDSTTSITIRDDTSNSVFLHELMHFIDYRINKAVPYFCYDNNEITYTENCNKLYYFVMSENRRLIIEAGAEINTLRYFGYMSGGYRQIDNIYTILSYLLGEQVMNDIYYSPHTFGELFKELLKYNINIDEFIKLMENGSYLSIENNFVGKIEDKRTEPEVMVEIMDTLSKIYKNKYKKNWNNDKVFSYLMKMCIRSPYNYAHFTEEEMAKVLKKAKNINKEEIEVLSENIDDSIISNQIKDLSLIELSLPSYNFYINNNKILIEKSYKEKNKVNFIVVDYNIEKEKVNGYTKIVSFSENVKAK